MKTPKRTKEWHASSSKYGMGDFYGQGVRNPIGTVKRDYLNDSVPKAKKMKPPKSLA